MGVLCILRTVFQTFCVFSIDALLALYPQQISTHTHTQLRYVSHWRMLLLLLPTPPPPTIPHTSSGLACYLRTRCACVSLLQQNEAANIEHDLLHIRPTSNTSHARPSAHIRSAHTVSRIRQPEKRRSCAVAAKRFERSICCPGSNVPSAAADAAGWLAGSTCYTIATRLADSIFPTLIRDTRGGPPRLDAHTHTPTCTQSSSPRFRAHLSQGFSGRMRMSRVRRRKYCYTMSRTL